jgi:hypothetical protein
MQGCIAPSEIPGVSAGDASTFGAVAEDIIYADFHAQYGGGGPTELFRDANNPAAYLFFLAVNNPHFTEARQQDYYRQLRLAGLGWRIPDFMVHNSTERAFYEVKPDSRTGLAAGMEKVGILSAAYRHFQLPYRAGRVFVPRDHVVASYGSVLRVTLRVRRAADGLILYKLCVTADGVLEVATLAALLRLVVQEMNRQRGRGRFRPIDLEPVFQRQRNLEDLARLLGLTAGTVGTALVVRATWRHFWKAVARRFALRGSTAAALSLVDGPLPFGEMVSAGLAVWTIIDVIRLSDELWRDADRIAREEA